MGGMQKFLFRSSLVTLVWLLACSGVQTELPEGYENAFGGAKMSPLSRGGAAGAHSGAGNNCTSCTRGGASGQGGRTTQVATGGQSGAANGAGGASQNGDTASATGGKTSSNGGRSAGGQSSNGGKNAGGQSSNGGKNAGGHGGLALGGVGAESGGSAAGGRFTSGGASNAGAGSFGGAGGFGGAESGGGGEGGGAPRPSPFFSEYVEGSASYKALEVAASAPRELSGCQIEVYANGSSKRSRIIELNGVVEREHPLVVCTPELASLIASCELVESLSFTGNDAVVLVCDGASADAFGRISEDPGATGWGTAPLRTADITLRRACALNEGDHDATDDFDPATEWISAGLDAFDDLGVHCAAP